ncbi:MAG: cobaltochelatase subunit CobN, partial [Gallionella sp.]
MFLNNAMLIFLRACLASLMLIACTAYAVPVAAPIRVSLMMGGNDTVTAADAARLLKADPFMRNVKVKVYSLLDFPAHTATAGIPADKTFLSQSQHIFVSTSVGRRFIDLAGIEIKQATRAGGQAYVVGSVWDSDFAGFGLTKNPELTAYKDAGGAVNLANMERAALAKTLKLKAIAAPDKLPEMAYYNPLNNQSYADFASYRKDCIWCKPGRAYVGIMMYRNNALSGKGETAVALAYALAARGLNPLVTYGI